MATIQTCDACDKRMSGDPAFSVFRQEQFTGVCDHLVAEVCSPACLADFVRDEYGTATR